LLALQIREKLKNMGLESESNISWRKSEGEKVFHQESNFMANSNNQVKVFKTDPKNKK